MASKKPLARSDHRRVAFSFASACFPFSFRAERSTNQILSEGAADETKKNRTEKAKVRFVVVVVDAERERKSVLAWCRVVVGFFVFLLLSFDKTMKDNEEDPPCFFSLS